jgi:hypothetical protein
MPSVAKFYRVRILPSALYASLRTRFSSAGSKQSSFAQLSDDTSAKKLQKSKFRSPYSIPTTGLSNTYASDFSTTQTDDHLELTKLPDGYEKGKSEISATGQRGFVAQGQISRTLSFDQSSMSFKNPSK